MSEQNIVRKVLTFFAFSLAMAPALGINAWACCKHKKCDHSKKMKDCDQKDCKADKAGCHCKGSDEK